jgi:hypothetical protein
VCNKDGVFRIIGLITWRHERFDDIHERASAFSGHALVGALAAGGGDQADSLPAPETLCRAQPSNS